MALAKQFRTSALGAAALVAFSLLAGAAAPADVLLQVADGAASVLPDAHDPHGRARALGLSDPTDRPDPNGRAGTCAQEVSQSARPDYRPAAAACFASDSEADDFIAGRSRRAAGGTQTVTLAGSGGNPVWATTGSTSYRQLGYSCQYPACDSSTNYRWYTTTSSGNCTHLYPANDLYVDNIGTNQRRFRSTNSTEPYVPNCNRTALYIDAYQGGAGASLWHLRQRYARTVTTGDIEPLSGKQATTWLSMSWHYSCDQDYPCA